MGIIHGGGLKNNTIIKSGYLALKLAEVRCKHDITLVLLLGLVTNFPLPV